MSILAPEQVAEKMERAQARPTRPEWLSYIRISQRTILGTRKPADFVIAFGPAAWGLAAPDTNERKAESRRNAIVDWLWMWIEKGIAAARTDLTDLCRSHEALRANIAVLNVVITADEERLRTHGQRVGMFFGCDTAEHMADEIESLRAKNEELRQVIQTLLDSAHPHPVEHPTMTAAWAVGRAALSAQPKEQA